ncbi:hypothetical protein BT67DRAFT_378099 [Trichocladium antarcticum]|uniref:Uncharacterized protein n=1 Tax=Trichocladium antarcticum TaxID=1450529 RepID=A0AAN6ZEW5_9PEZI|nr:hypothetical protein BT67DRAFT_378099 [Trichocladium antarcticum]
MADFAYHQTPAPMANERWLSSRRCEPNLEAARRERNTWKLTAIPSPIYNNTFYSGRFETGSTPSLPQSVYSHSAASTHNLPATFSAGNVGQFGRPAAEPPFPSPASHNPRLTPGPYTSPAPGPVAYNGTASFGWDRPAGYPGNSQGPYQGRYSPSDSMDDLASPSLSDYSLDNGATSGGGPMAPGGKSKLNGKPRVQRRPSNRDEFDGPHQFLKRPPPEYIAMQERELPRLPTHLLVQEQDSVLNQVNDRLSQCAFDFVAKYQFPIPLSQDMRPVERPQDREWTEWVYLLKRLATKRRIPARVLYNGQIRQFVTILENSLEMRHAARHQSRPLKDDRNILQLISAGIQVAKILKDAQAMDYLDRLYVSTEHRIQERAAAAAAASAGAARFR